MARARVASGSAGWLLGLAFAGGVLDATSYLGLGGVFPANMTGNTVLLAVAVARGSGAAILGPAIALGGFCVGVLLAVTMIPPRRRPWPDRAGWALLLELCLLVALLLAWALIGVHAIRYALIAIAGAAMGVQSGVVRTSDTRGVHTTYMTGTLIAAISRLVERLRHDQHGAGAPSLPGAAWLTYGAGALAGAYTVGSWGSGALALPLLILGAITAAAWRGRSSNPA